MKLDIQFRGLESTDALRDHTERKLHASLSRFGQRIRAVEVRITDVNGPRGGEDKICRINVRTPLGAVSVRKASADAYAAVHLAVESMERAMAGKLARSRTMRRRPRRVERAVS